MTTHAIPSSIAPRVSSSTTSPFESLSDDELTLILSRTGSGGYANCTRVCFRWSLVCRKDDVCKQFVQRAFGVADGIVPADIVCAPFDVWWSLLRVCHTTLCLSPTGRAASDSAYWTNPPCSNGLGAKETFVRSPTFASTVLAPCTPIPCTFVSCDGIWSDKDSVDEGTLFRRVFGFRAFEMQLSHFDICDICSNIRTLVCGPESCSSCLATVTTERIKYDLHVNRFRTGTDGSVVVRLRCPSIVTGAMVLVAQPPKYAVRQVLVFVGAREEDVSSELSLTPTPTLWKRLRKSWRPLHDHTVSGIEPFAAVELPSTSTRQCIAFGPPTLCRFVRFKLVTAFGSEERLARGEAAAFDLNSISVLGVELESGLGFRG